VKIGKNVTLLAGTILQGSSVIGDDCEIGPNTRLANTTVGAGSRVVSTIANHVKIGEKAIVGPSAKLAPGTTVAGEAILDSF